ncbi:MAG TPA: SUMF1/EgtB/PvdO family nonheme iron enzyme [Pirellulales bacterium]|jgi:formylglycine-generating enzyme required for sulfatase activity|nr:SUMF1/EgtB/PvdO family nonheme iron enzyme [Pirellulales bacterium]
MVDYYQVLGLGPEATLAQIGERYRFLVQAYHPDKFARDQHKAEATEEFKKITEAFGVLSNPTRRAAYDSKRAYFNALDQRSRTSSEPRPKPEPAQAKKPASEPPQPKPQPKPQPEPPKAKPASQPQPANKPPPQAKAAPRPASTKPPAGARKPRRARRFLGWSVAVVLLSAAAAAIYFQRELTVWYGRWTGAAAAATAHGESQPAADAETNSLGLTWAAVSPGEFLMGSPETELGDFGKHELRERQHRVQLTRRYWISVEAVTQAEYEQVMGTNPSYFCKTGNGRQEIAELDTKNLPVEQVSWFDAVEFCNKLSERDHRSPCYRLERAQRTDRSIVEADVTMIDGTGYRLPSEAEWECACRAGTTTPFSFGAALNGTEANCDGGAPYGTEATGPARQCTVRVGAYPPNAFGLYDMHGNVRQWCQDWYDAEPSSAGLAVDPQGPSAGKFRVVRGGGFMDSAVHCRAAYCFEKQPDDRSNDLGFRIVRTSE